MSHATSNWIIIVCLVIFATVGIFGTYAGYTTTGYTFNPDGSRTPSGDTVPVAAVNYPWWDVWDQASQVFNSIIHTATDILTAIPGLGFLFAIALFDVPGMPLGLTLMFYLLGVILVIASTRVIAGLLTGGGG